ncbi:MAG: YvcK family protein [Halanaerobiales bacterium]|nr:YvcK family protein [Halanaerobiales bacterium]MCF8008380.1 YvcK family protein [Halanaerobiales bacterium]
MKLWKWLYPGLGIKRWFVIGILALLLLSTGIALLLQINIVDYIIKGIYEIVTGLSGTLNYYTNMVIGIVLIIISLALLTYAGNRFVKKLNEEIYKDDDFVNVLFKKNQLQKGPKIVALGGGTGLSNLLRGLKEFSSNITALVTVADDGGSSGKLRNELDILPPGDIRNCIVALADKETLMEDLFQYRFHKEGDLRGHSFGNLFIAAMTEVLGDFEESVEESSKVLAIRGKVIPSTNEKVNLGAVYEDGSEIIGESEIPNFNKKIKKVFLKPGDVEITEKTKNAILEAEYILVGPGSLYTSLIPNLLVKNMSETIEKSSAKKVFINNIMTQPGETTDHSASDHLKAINQHIGKNLFEYIVINKNGSNKKLLKKYAYEGAYPVRDDRDILNNLGIKVIDANLIQTGDFIRHDPYKLAKIILDI